MAEETTATPEALTAEAAPAPAPAPSGESLLTGDVTATTETSTAVDETTAEVTTEAPAETLQYTDFTVPEGTQVFPEMLDEFKAAALEAGIKQEQAQHLVDMGLKLQSKLIEQQQQKMAAQNEQWLAETKADKEFGGDKLNENLAIAKRAMDAFVSPGLKELFDSTGLGNHPDMVRAFIKAGRLISEDSLVPGTTAPEGAGKTAASILYPNHN